MSVLINLSALLDDAKCFELVRQTRWPQGVRCPKCGGEHVVRNGHDDTQPHRQRYLCNAGRRRKKGRKGRRNRLKGAPGCGTLEKEKPPILGMIQRGGQVVLEMLANVQQTALVQIAEAGHICR